MHTWPFSLQLGEEVMLMPSETTSNNVLGDLKRLGLPRAARRGVSCPES